MVNTFNAALRFMKMRSKETGMKTQQKHRITALKRGFTAFFLAFVLAVGMIPSGVFAYASDEEPSENAASQVAQDNEENGASDEGANTLAPSDASDGADASASSDDGADGDSSDSSDSSDSLLLADANSANSVSIPLDPKDSSKGYLVFEADEVSGVAGEKLTIHVAGSNSSAKNDSKQFAMSAGAVSINPSGQMSFDGAVEKQGIKKGASGSWDFTASIPESAMSGTYTVPVTITYDGKTDYVLNVPVTITAAQSDVVLNSASDSGSQLSGYAGTYDQEYLELSFGLMNYNQDASDYSWSLTLKASDSATGELSDVTASVSPVWDPVLPGSASEGSEGTGSVEGNYIGTSTVKIDVSGLDPNQENVVYEATLTVTDTLTGKVTSKTVSVHRACNDLSNHVFKIINVGTKNSYAQTVSTYKTFTGTDWFDDLYYVNVKKDSRVPFSDAQGFKDYLASLPEDQVDTEFNKYIYDLYNTNTSVEGTDYGDESSSKKWPKDEGTPFHAVASNGVNNLTYSLSEGGVKYDEDYFQNLSKTATVEGRSGSIELSADAEPQVVEPRVYLIRMQESWQMFDTKHATAGVEAAAMYPNGVDSMANFYDVKQALLRFNEYLREKSGGSAALALLTFGHPKEFTMFTGSGFFCNDSDTIEAAIRGWDTFGDCEHSHYTDTLLDAALKNISSEFANWKDSDNNLIGDKVKKTAIFIGGSCEATKSDNGYAVTLDKDLLTTSVDNAYAIRTVDGTPSTKNADGEALYSWLDYGTNRDIWNKEGNGYYVSTTEDEIYNALVEIFEKDSVADTTTYGNVNAQITDTVQKEFKVTGATATWVSEADGNVTEIPQDSIKIVEKEDGSTEVTCDYGECTGAGTVNLKIAIEARDDYIGGNNVLTNVDVPTLSFSHTNKTTGKKTEASKDFTEKPTVNVSLLDLAVTGGSGLHKVGNPFNLADFGEADLTDLLTGYPQTNGTLKLEWVEVDEQGNPLPDQTISFTANEYRVDNGTLDGTIELPECEVNSDTPLTRNFQLKVTYTPDPATNGLPDVGTKVVTAPVDLTWTDEAMVALQIHKIDASTKASLENVSFGLYDDSDCTQLAGVFSDEACSDVISGKGVTTDAEGLAGFYGLEIGKTYYLKETQVHAGYALTDQVWTIKAESESRVTVNGIDASGSTITPASGGDGYWLATMTVDNQKNPDLPLAGMLGIGFFVVLGGAFAAAGLTLGMKNRRMKGAGQ